MDDFFERLRELENSVAELQGMMEARRHDHERVQINSQDIAEAHGRIDRLSDRLEKLIAELSNREDNEAHE